MKADGERGYLLSNAWLIGCYAAVFVGFSAIVNVDLARLSPVQDALQVDGRTHRLVVTRQETAAARFSLEHDRRGLHFQARALRGLQLTLEDPRAELGCEFEVAHRHPVEATKRRLVVAFAAKSAVAATRLFVSMGTKPPGSTDGFFRLAELELQPEWREVRAEVNLYQPQGPVAPFRTLLFEFRPPSKVDSWIREPRLLTEAVEPDIERP
ncbi:MAG TPA: hypothetical protein VG937_35475 [Polyangiaceae bacterium]|nr:hypothetical protein [Polyangiaceae bacterium]